jgi:hypothetical protein
MGQTRMFRDRVVSMEQTLEGGEKHLELLKALCLEAFPDLPYRDHTLDHERDLFVVTLEAPDGRRKTVGWTRMTLFDVERIPALAAEPSGPLREKLLSFLRDRASRPEILVTFRHLEEGWTDTPEPRPSRRRRRRSGGRGGGQRPPERAPQGRQGAPRSGGAPGPRGVPAPGARPVPAPPVNRPAGAPPAGEARPSSSRRRSRRRRRGRGGSPGPAPARTP